MYPITTFLSIDIAYEDLEHWLHFANFKRVAIVLLWVSWNIIAQTIVPVFI